MKIIIGIDPSLTATGIAHPEGVHTIASEPIGTTLTARHRRLRQILADLDNVVLGVKPFRFERKPDLVIVEAPSLGQGRQGGTLDRNGLWWLIVDRLHTLDIPVADVTPAQLKKFACGKGSGISKADMRMALYQRIGVDLRDDNQVDAWWLRAIGCHHLGEPIVDLPKTHLAALDKVRWPELEVVTVS